MAAFGEAAGGTGGRELLSTLALLSEAVDVDILQALNPHLPPEPEVVEEPIEPKQRWNWKGLSEEKKVAAQKSYRIEVQRFEDYRKAAAARLASREFLSATAELSKTVQDLERRGLLQHDPVTRHYDLHPVVRGFAAGGLRQEEREQIGGRVVDHFSSRSHVPYEEAETLDDLRDGLRIVRTLLQMGRFEQACLVYRGDLLDALLFNLERYTEILALLRPLFPRGWGSWPDALGGSDASYFGNSAALVLRYLGNYVEALSLFKLGLTADLREDRWRAALANLSNIALTFRDMRRLNKAEQFHRITQELSEVIDSKENLFHSRLYLFAVLSDLGRWLEAQALWEQLDPMGRVWSRAVYRPGQAEYQYCSSLFQQGQLTEGPMEVAESLARTGRNHITLRRIHSLRGGWLLSQGDLANASSRFAEAVRMARETHNVDARSETSLALARYKMGELPEPREEAERLVQFRDPAHRPLAELWLAIGDRARAEEHALKAYEQAWADGEPYVFRYALDRARQLLEHLGTPIPDLPPYDPAKDLREPWEDVVEEAIERLRVEKAAKAKKNEERQRPRG